MKSLMCLLIAATLAVAADVDVTGKWAGTFKMTGPNGEMDDSTAVLILKQSDRAITGTVGPNEDQQFPILKGKIDGDKITFEAEHDGHPLNFNLVLAAGRITGEVQISRDGQTMKGKLDLARSK